MGDVKVVELPQNYTLALESSKQMKVSIKVSSTETSVIFGNIVCETSNVLGITAIVLNDIHFASWTTYNLPHVLMWHLEICGKNLNGKTRYLSFHCKSFFHIFILCLESVKFTLCIKAIIYKQFWYGCNSLYPRYEQSSNDIFK